MGFGEQGWGPLLLQATFMTIAVSVCGYLFGLVFGVIGAWLKLQNGSILRIIGNTYTTVFRGVPDLLIIFLVYYGGNQILNNIVHFFGYSGYLSLPIFLTGAFAIGIVSGAYQTEVYRGAYLALQPGQIEAARAVGMHSSLIFRHIIAPQALRVALPGLGNTWLIVVKESALISVISLTELVRMADMGTGSTRRPFEFYVTAMFLYLFITFISGIIFKLSEKHFNRHIKGMV